MSVVIQAVEEVQACIICMESLDGTCITIACGSTVPHKTCKVCYVNWLSKMAVLPTQQVIGESVGTVHRIMKCPMCRAPEIAALRSTDSLFLELNMVYSGRVLPRAARVARVRAPVVPRAPRAPRVPRAQRGASTPRSQAAVDRAIVAAHPPAASQALTDAYAGGRASWTIQEINQSFPVFGHNAARAFMDILNRRLQAAAPAMAPVAPVARALVRPKRWCESGVDACRTKQPTQRKCKYPAGCERLVCRNCNMCMSHFVF